MCKYECFGDYYRGCQHTVIRYYSGERTDCNSPDCKGSSQHKHKNVRECPCPKVQADDIRIVNMFQFKCDMCIEASRSRSHR